MDRALDGTELAKRFAALVNKFLASYVDAVDLQRELLGTSFILATFSWRLSRVVIDKIISDNGIRKYVAATSQFPNSRSPTLSKAARFAIAGDLTHNYFETLSKCIDLENADAFDMEPFVALGRMLDQPLFTDRSRQFRGVIGGAPQLLKIYPFYRTIEFAVFWPDQASGRPYLNGPELFEFEKIYVPHIDGTTLEIHYPLEAVESSLSVSDSTTEP